MAIAQKTVETFGIIDAINNLDRKREVQYKAVDGTWHDIKYDKNNHTFVLDFDANTSFRLKPTFIPTPRVPFDYPMDCWNEMLKHEPFGWVVDEDGDKYLITGVVSDDNGYVEFLLNTTYHNPADYMFHYFKFADGTPFGKIAKG